MALTGNEGARIALEQAQRFVRNHRRQGGEHTERCGFFGRAVLESILVQPGCMGIRFYHARRDDGTPALVLVGVNAEGQDLTTGVLVDDHLPCPPYCDPSSALNV
jgi:hypothetical protein